MSINFTATAVNTLESYNPVTNIWTELLPMPTARFALGVGAIGGTLYAVGGFDGKNALDVVEAYDPTTNKWTQLPPMPSPTFDPGVGVLEGILYVVGGSNAPSHPINTVQAFMPSTTKSNTALNSIPNPSVFGQSVIMTATVTGLGSTPSGAVTFRDGAIPLNIASLNGAGIASFDTSFLAVGNHSLTAIYAGDATFSTSTSAVVVQRVDKANTSAVLRSDPSRSFFGELVTITAAVTSTAGTPSGTITFIDGKNVIGTSALNGFGKASFSASFTVGNHVLTAIYGGDSNYNGSTSAAITQEVKRANTSIIVSSSNSSSIVGQSLTFSAEVVPRIATGTVFFFDGAKTLGEVTLHNGKASFSTSLLKVGSHTIRAAYGGDKNFNGSSSPIFIQDVLKVPTSTTIRSGRSPLKLSNWYCSLYMSHRPSHLVR